MSKIALNKLNLSKNNLIKVLQWENQAIEVKQYLPILDKLSLIGKIINLSIDEHSFYNPCKLKIFYSIELVLAYTNIDLTKKQSEDALKIYDLFISSGLYNKIEELIPQNELDYINDGVNKVIAEIYRHRDSAVGIIESVVQDFQDTELNVNNILDKMSNNSENLQAIKEIVTKLD